MRAVRVRAWVSGWLTTLHIMIFERETYRLLCSDIDMSEDMTEVRAPYMACYLATDDTPGEIIPELAWLIREPRQAELPADGGYVVLPAESEAADCELYTELGRPELYRETCTCPSHPRQS